MNPQDPASVLEELDRIVHLYRDVDEQLRRWLALWQQHLQGDKILVADLDVAVRITLTGTHIAQHQKRYQDALDLFTALSTHPDFARVDPGWLVSFYAGQMLCYLRLEEEAQAAAVGYQLLRLGPEEEDQWQARNLLCTCLFTHVLCGKPCRGGEEEATAEFTRLVADTLRAVDPEVPMDPLPERATYQELEPLVTRAAQKVTAERESAVDTGQVERIRKNGLTCRCGHRLTRSDLIEQKTYVPQYYGASKVVVLFQCSHCQQKSHLSIKQEEWDESLLDVNAS